MTKDLSHAENLIQIWARKKMFHDHREGDTYDIRVELEDYGSCPTCSSPFAAVNLYRTRTITFKGPNGKPKERRERKCVWTEQDIDFTTIFNEMLQPLEPVD